MVEPDPTTDDPGLRYRWEEEEEEEEEEEREGVGSDGACGLFSYVSQTVSATALHPAWVSIMLSTVIKEWKCIYEELLFIWGRLI